jgi:hypothetical protein
MPAPRLHAQARIRAEARGTTAVLESRQDARSVSHGGEKERKTSHWCDWGVMGANGCPPAPLQPFIQGALTLLKRACQAPHSRLLPGRLKFCVCHAE